MNTTASTTLRQLITLWPDLTDALGAPTQHSWPPVELKGYLNAMERLDSVEAAALRALERDPNQIGTRPVPLSLRVHDTMRDVEAALAECADVVAASSQIEPITFPGKDWPKADQARRHAAAMADLADPRRWRYRGKTPGARYTALWLLARVEGRPGPFRTLGEQQHRHIRLVAAGALQRVEQVLDLTDVRRELTAAHPCPCGGTIEVYGGAGATPVARCKGCGAIWSEAGVIAASDPVSARTTPEGRALTPRYDEAPAGSLRTGASRYSAAGGAPFRSVRHPGLLIRPAKYGRASR